MTKIALLVPTRSRPLQLKRMLDSVKRTATTDVNIYVYIATDDPLAEQYITDEAHVVKAQDYPTVHKWNHLAELAQGWDENKLFMLAADDIIFESHGWDQALIDHYEKLDNKIHCYALQDSRDPDGTPHPVFSREWIEVLGYFISPIFLHFYPDTWGVSIAKANGVFTHLKDYLLRHDKPSDRGQPDETHLGIRRMGFHERDRYVNDTCQHFLQYEKKRLDNIMRRKESEAA